MNDYDKRLELLKSENPFISSSVGNPWEDKYPDIDSINAVAFNGLSQLIGQKTKNPVLPCAGLVFGETGSGKTHLIGRVLKHGKTADRPFSFAYIQPIEDPEQTYRYLLREIIVNLCYPVDRSSLKTQLDFIIDRIIKDVENKPLSELQAGLNTDLQKIEPTKSPSSDSLMDEFGKSMKLVFQPKKLNEDFFLNLTKAFRIFLELVFVPAENVRSGNVKSGNENNETAKKETEALKPANIEELSINFIRSKFPEIPKDFIKVLLQYRSSEKRGAVIEWLKGGILDETDTALLGVPDRIYESSPLQEQEAKNILNSLGILLAHYGQPLVICFDRLENYDTDMKKRSLEVMTEYLVDHAKAMLPIVFVRGAQWEEKFSKKLNQQVVTRLSTNEFSLKGCNDVQAVEIIKSRLTSVLDEKISDDLYPFDKDELSKTFKDRLYSPRQVIMQANQQLRTVLYPDESLPKPVLSSEKLKKEFESQCTDIITDFDRYPADRSRLKRALELYINNKSPETGFYIESIEVPEDKFIDFICKVRPEHGDLFDAVIIIDVESNNPSVRASLKRGIDFLKENSSSKAIYIRDSRCEIPAPPAWKATNEMLDEFRQLGGHDIFLDKDQTARWYALALLNYAVKEGDISVQEGDKDHRPVSFEELTKFIREYFHVKEYSGFWRVGQILKGV
ncbi:ATP-binding protein [Desulfobacterales bacterium HSG17]|nr:ATP-binding protein [Desulfobacterales bacterium HSG17]